MLQGTACASQLDAMQEQIVAGRQPDCLSGLPQLLQGLAVTRGQIQCLLCGGKGCELCGQADDALREPVLPGLCSGLLQAEAEASDCPHYKACLGVP